MNKIKMCLIIFLKNRKKKKGKWEENRLKKNGRKAKIKRAGRGREWQGKAKGLY